MKRNKIFLLLSLITLTLQLGCSKNALFHVKPIRQPNKSRYNTQRPVSHVRPTKPIQSVKPKSPIQNTTPKQDPPSSYLPSKPTLFNPTPMIPSVASTSIPTATLPPKTVQVTQQKSPYLFQDFFPYRRIQKTFHQITNEKNKTTLFFQAFDSHGLNIRDLQENELTLYENQVPIRNYTLSSERQRLDHTLEIVFVIDTAGSMKKYIDTIRTHVTYLVSKLEKDQIRANLCLVTFKDLVERICQFFYPDNPLTLLNENTVKFLNDLSRLKLYRGDTYHENVLGGLLSAARHTPWSPGNQRMVILVTDALFWVPLYSHPEARTSSNYLTVLNALRENNIQVFALTHDYDGFSKNYFKDPSLVEATSGQWFNIKTLEEKNMQTVFDHIRDQLNIFYKIEYFVEDQEELNPFLPLRDRKISLTMNTIQNSYEEEDIQIEIQDIHSNLPEGATRLLSHWDLSEPNIKKDNPTVTVNGVEKEIHHNFFIENGQIFFTEPPSSGSEVLVRYELEGLINNIQKHPLVLQSSTQADASNFSLLLNGKKADHTYFEINPADDGSLSLNLRNRVFSDEDPFDIRRSNRLSISLSYEAI